MKSKIIEILLKVIGIAPKLGVIGFLLYMLVKTILCHGFGVCFLF